MSAEQRRLTLILIAIGAGWAMTQPLGKIVVSAGYLPLGIVVWQLVIGTVLTAGLLIWQGRPLPVTRRSAGFWVVIALIGTLIPNLASFSAMQSLPAGVMSIVISAIPMMAFPLALVMGIDAFSRRRLLGLCLGMGGVALIALPETSLPDPAMVAVLPLALLAPLFYALEGNVVAKWGTGGQDALQLLCGASLVGALIALPLALQSGQFVVPHFPPSAIDWAMFGASAIHVTVYVIYVWLVGRAGAVFAAQVSYLVTGFGVLWSMLLLGERYSGWIWAALVLMALGLLMVQPRTQEALADSPATGDSNPKQVGP